jgi:hypothetical protein
VLRFIVRRGALRRFDRLKRATEGLPVDVMWDRRTKKPTPEEAARRQDDRRQQPTLTWTEADFVVTEEDDTKA